MKVNRSLLTKLENTRSTWLVTGAAGFIGSHLVESLLQLGQIVVGLDNYSTGRKENLVEVRNKVGANRWRAFSFTEGDILDTELCQKICSGVDYVLHQAALGSVPRSIEDPLSTHAANVTGFLNIISASINTGVQRVVYASSSSVYGSHQSLPKKEENIGEALSPYALSKRINELYAGVFNHCYGLPSVGLRYFNVYGPRQDPQGPYAAVIPKWISAMIEGREIEMNGDGKITRDFCFVDNVIQANILAAVTEYQSDQRSVMNVAMHQQISLNDLYELLRKKLALKINIGEKRVKQRPERPGDIRHSLADISLIRERLGYAPEHGLSVGLDKTLDWYLKNYI